MIPSQNKSYAWSRVVLWSSVDGLKELICAFHMQVSQCSDISQIISLLEYAKVWNFWNDQWLFQIIHAVTSFNFAKQQSEWIGDLYRVYMLEHMSENMTQTGPSSSIIHATMGWWILLQQQCTYTSIFHIMPIGLHTICMSYLFSQLIIKEQ